jgi:anti-sigma B factor antagonist
MKFDLREKGGIVVISIEGKMVGGPDATLLSEKLHECVESGKKRFVLDMAQVDWMNSSGLGILIGGLSTVRNHGGNLKLANLGKKPRELLEITKLDRIFETYDKEDAALASFA